MTPLQAKIDTITETELFALLNNIKVYATSRDISPDNLKLAVDAIIAINKRLHPYECFSQYEFYRVYGVVNPH